MQTAHLQRIVCACAAMPAARARAVLGVVITAASADKPQAVNKRWKEHFDSRKPFISEMAAKIKKQLDFAKAEMLRAIEHLANTTDEESVKSSGAIQAGGSGAAGDVMFDLDTFKTGLKAALRKTASSALQAAGDQVFDEVGKDDPFTMPPKAALSFLKDREKKISDASDDIFSEIKAHLKEGFEAGESHAKLADRIEQAFAGISEGRADTIASTETSAAFGFSRNAAMKQAGITHKKWLTSGLPNVRDAHAEMEGETVPFDEPFVVTGPAGETDEIMFPGDPDGEPWNVINCHCVALSTLEPNEEDAA